MVSCLRLSLSSNAEGDSGQRGEAQGRGPTQGGGAGALVRNQVLAAGDRVGLTAALSEDLGTFLSATERASEYGKLTRSLLRLYSC